MLRGFKRFLGIPGTASPRATGQSREFDVELDARGWNCPVPVLRAKNALNALRPGEVLHVVATDPGSVVDFPALARESGSTLLKSTEEDGEFHYLLRKQ